ncbi:MAG: squalene/phytoene synthase family protein [Alphaproteobacteria bacterium]|nr:squalene/phytoene synthase family protein [Alphaproteobacteria bacterium]
MDDLDTLVRRVDEDRWLAVRFAPPRVRERLIAICAVSYEIARTAETVREAALGAIRLEWWREGLEEIVEGKALRIQPALEALKRVAKDQSAAATLQQMVAARGADFDAQPFTTWGDVDDYLDATAGVLLRVSMEQCEAPRGAPDRFVTVAGRAWGYTGLLRAAEYWRARGRSALPKDGGNFDEMRQRACAAHEDARALARALPQEMFPAFGYLALVPGYLKATEQGRAERALFLRQLSMIAASATGAI